MHRGGPLGSGFLLLFLDRGLLMTTPEEALASFVKKDPTAADFESFVTEVNKDQNDRTVAVLLGSSVETTLRTLIKRKLVITDDSDKILFHSSGPLHSFDAKIKLGFATGLFGSQTRANLHAIKVVRNSFAHTLVALTFETEVVRKVCEVMVPPPYIPTGEPNNPLVIDVPDAKNPKKRFQKIAETTGHNLLIFATLPDSVWHPQSGTFVTRLMYSPLP